MLFYNLKNKVTNYFTDYMNYGLRLKKKKNPKPLVSPNIKSSLGNETRWSASFEAIQIKAMRAGLDEEDLSNRMQAGRNSVVFQATMQKSFYSTECRLFFINYFGGVTVCLPVFLAVHV